MTRINCLRDPNAVGKDRPQWLLVNEQDKAEPAHAKRTPILVQPVGDCCEPGRRTGCAFWIPGRSGQCRQEPGRVGGTRSRTSLPQRGRKVFTLPACDEPFDDRVGKVVDFHLVHLCTSPLRGSLRLCESAILPICPCTPAACASVRQMSGATVQVHVVPTQAQQFALAHR